MFSCILVFVIVLPNCLLSLFSLLFTIQSPIEKITTPAFHSNVPCVYPEVLRQELWQLGLVRPRCKHNRPVNFTNPTRFGTPENQHSSSAQQDWSIIGKVMPSSQALKGRTISFTLPIFSNQTVQKILKTAISQFMNLITCMYFLYMNYTLPLAEKQSFSNMRKIHAPFCCWIWMAVITKLCFSDSI